MEQSNVNTITDRENNQRPSFLATLCILTFIGSGLGVIMNLIIALNYQYVVNLIETFGQTTSSMLPSAQNYFFMAFFSLLSLLGAIMMWGYRKLGFYSYALAQTLMVVYPIIISKGQGVNTFGIILAGLFIFLYALNYKELIR